mgnify:FL=1
MKIYEIQFSIPGSLRRGKKLCVCPILSVLYQGQISKATAAEPLDNNILLWPTLLAAVFIIGLPLHSKLHCVAFVNHRMIK